MVVNFKKLRFSNILSFGAKVTEIEFNNGLNLITGQNGAGKSTMLDALSFCLYGKPYRNINLNELINRRNKKSMLVECEFQIDEKDNYLIRRTLKPASIEIFKNDFTQPMDILSSKKLNQEEIDKILGVDYSLFKQVISLAVNYNKPFLSISAQEKRNIIEYIFGISVFGQMLKILKKKNNEVKIKNDLNKNNIVLLEENIKSLRRSLKELNEAKENFDKNKENDLKKITERIDNYKNQKITYEKEVAKKTKEISQLKESDSSELLSKNKELNKSINELEFEIKNCNKKINFLSNNTICPECNIELTPDHKNLELSKLNKIINDNSELLAEKKLNKNETDKQIELIDNNNKATVKLKNEMALTKSKLDMINQELINLEQNKTEIEQRKLSINIDDNQKEFDTKIIEYKLIHKEGLQLQEKIKNNDVAADILSETGIKAYFFKKLIPILNSKINEYLKLFEISINLNFDEFMAEKITNSGNSTNDISYYSYSEGEKKRIDIAILLSFISITKSISNWNCNILLIDELLDGAIDENGLDRLISCIKNMTKESKQLGIYVISHRLNQDYIEYFDSIIKTQKNSNNFSTITVN